MTSSDEKKSKYSFKHYYAIPEFRKKHLKYMTEKVPCPECGFVTVRSNMTRHKRSSNHAKRLRQRELDVARIREENEKLKQETEKLRKKIKKMKKQSDLS